jgi:hypothetical protein
MAVDSPCYRAIVAYYFHSAREPKAGRLARDRRRDEAEVSGVSNGPRKNAAKKIQRYGSLRRGAGQEL